MNNTVSDEQLPPLPEMGYLGDDASYGYDASDMQAYAKEYGRKLLALKAERPVAQTDLLDMLVAISSAVADSDERAAQSMLREAINMVNQTKPAHAAPPAAQGEPVAWGWVTRYLTRQDDEGSEHWTDWYACKSDSPNPPSWSRGSYAQQEAVRVYTHPSPAAQVPEGLIAWLKEVEWSRTIYDGFGNARDKCLECRNEDFEGHEDDCKLKGFITALSASPKPPEPPAQAPAERWPKESGYWYHWGRGEYEASLEPKRNVPLVPFRDLPVYEQADWIAKAYPKAVAAFSAPKPPEPCEHRWCSFGDLARLRCVKCDTPAPVIGRPPEPPAQAVEQAVSAEREACALLAEKKKYLGLAFMELADAIRARSSQAEKGGAL